LQPLLGDSFVVVDDEWLEGDDIVITPTMSEPVLGLLKSRHPGCLVLCVVRQAPPASAEVVTALDHGADGCVVHPSMAELAAHVKALVRLSVGR
jgi:DNA-binding response OmpR family regulator